MFCCTGNECPDVTVHWMTHYVVYSAAAIGEMSSWHFKSKLFYFSVCSEPSSLCSDGYNSNQSHFIANTSSTRCISICYKSNKSEVLRQISTWMSRLDVCLLKSQTLLTSEKVMIAWKWASKCVFYFNKLVSCKIRGEKKIYICYILYMVCIVFVKINQNRVLQDNVLVWGCMKRREGSQLKRN